MLLYKTMETGQRMSKGDYHFYDSHVSSENSSGGPVLNESLDKFVVVSSLKAEIKGLILVRLFEFPPVYVGTGNLFQNGFGE